MEENVTELWCTLFCIKWSKDHFVAPLLYNIEELIRISYVLWPPVLKPANSLLNHLQYIISKICAVCDSELFVTLFFTYISIIRWRIQWLCRFFGAKSLMLWIFFFFTENLFFVISLWCSCFWSQLTTQHKRLHAKRLHCLKSNIQTIRLKSSYPSIIGCLLKRSVPITVMCDRCVFIQDNSFVKRPK